MGKRFKSLDAALRYLRTTGTTSTDTTPDAPAGSQLKKYQDYKAGKVQIEYTWAETSKPGDLEEALVKPFAVASADTDLAIVDYSNRAKNNLSASGVTADLLNHATTGTGTRIIGFTPARATVIVYGTTAATQTTSKITGKPYKKKTNQTYTYPFGQATDAANYKAAKAAIAEAVASGNTNRGVSFKSEVYR